jgi:hypothetical protein
MEILKYLALYDATRIPLLKDLSDVVDYTERQRMLPSPCDESGRYDPLGNYGGQHNARQDEMPLTLMDRTEVTKIQFL